MTMPAPSTSPRKILLVEDDPNILLGLEELLRREGFQTVSCDKGDRACALVKREHPHLIVLDVMLPGRNGYDVCKELRQSGVVTPVLMLTAKGQEMDKVIGLELGADDYVTKPFGLRELLARIHALLRRGQRGSDASEPDAAQFVIGASTINPRTYQLTRKGNIQTLTHRELRLLQLFHAHPGEVLSRDELLNRVWGYRYLGTTRTLDQVIVQLRKKLGEASRPRHLLTVHGVGYKLVL